MKIRRMPLICGGAALFALAGCETTGGGAADAAQADGSGGDSGGAGGDSGGPGADGSGQDAASVDASTPDGGGWDASSDVGSWDGASWDAGSPDSVGPWDAGSPDSVGPWDGGSPDSVGPWDAGSPDGGGGDAWGLDGWTPTDTGPWDAGSPDTSDPNAPKLGDPCEMGYTAWCDASATPTLFCGWTEAGQAWIPYENDGSQYCWCEPATSPGITYCAVPGFVGLDRAGRARKARTLRSLRASAQRLAA
ncbi:MAG: hypothetical protein AMXMBFR64_27580 [Myxococcales bacterium]